MQGTTTYDGIKVELLEIEDNGDIVSRLFEVTNKEVSTKKHGFDF
jgi:hypothetical protein